MVWFTRGSIKRKENTSSHLLQSVVSKYYQTFSFLPPAVLSRRKDRRISSICGSYGLEIARSLFVAKYLRNLWRNLSRVLITSRCKLSRRKAWNFLPTWTKRNSSEVVSKKYEKTWIGRAGVVFVYWTIPVDIVMNQREVVRAEESIWVVCSFDFWGYFPAPSLY